MNARILLLNLLAFPETNIEQSMHVDDASRDCPLDAPLVWRNWAARRADRAMRKDGIDKRRLEDE